VELAQLNFRLSRLTGHGKELSRLGGGIGTRGPGEKKLEVDRRKIRKRIDHLKKELKKVEKTRNVHRKSRDGAFSVALLGYTNAGKTTLLNAFTNSNAVVEDKLFVTLDPLTRLAKTYNNNKFLLIDTVGFIRGIPTEIMSSFKSTLEEAKNASLRIILVDSSSEVIEEELEETRKVMDFLGISDADNILTFNKIDRVIDSALLNHLQRKYPKAVFISAKENKGLENLMERIDAYKKRLWN
jgi:GTP-binding protein HflX